MKKIGILSTNRADYYLLSPIIKRLKSNNLINTKFIVSGGHLLDEYGMTINDIGDDIDHVISFNNYHSSNVINSTNGTLISIMESANDFFSSTFFDYVIVLGDRFEVAGVALVLFNLNIPILHIYGGEVTLGSKDNTFRYIISLMSKFHFVSNEIYGENLINFGIKPDSIFQIGYISYDLIKLVPMISFEEIIGFDKLGLNFNKYAVISLHPPTNEDVNVDDQIKLLVELVSHNLDILFVATSSNNDSGGGQINQWYINSTYSNKNLLYIPNLGFDKYINLIRHSFFVIGNSSSLLTDVPILNKPSIVLGKRQEGRESLGPIIRCEYDFSCITKAIDKISSNPNSDNNDARMVSAVDEFEKYFNNVIQGVYS